MAMSRSDVLLMMSCKPKGFHEVCRSWEFHQDPCRLGPSSRVPVEDKRLAPFLILSPAADTWTLLPDQLLVLVVETLNPKPYLKP